MGLCEPADVYRFGAPRGSLGSVSRLVSSVDADADAIELDEHGFEDGLEVRFRAEAGGSLPSPLVEGTAYFARVLDVHRFQVAATSGGAAIDLTTEGETVLVLEPSPLPAAIDWATAIIEDMLPAHIVPLEAPYPPVLVATCAELATGKALSKRGLATETLSDMLDKAHARVSRWARGAVVRGTNQPPAANLAASTASAPAADPRGWRKYGGL